MTERSQELGEILTRHTSEYLTGGVYQTWIGVVSRYFGHPDDSNPEEIKTQMKAELNSFARTELPLAAITRNDFDRRHPGFNSHFLIKVDPDTGQRIKYGQFGTEPIIVAITNDSGEIVEHEDVGPKETPYSHGQVQLVIRNALEIKEAGFKLST
jgi:hypothetical protein